MCPSFKEYTLSGAYHNEYTRGVVTINKTMVNWYENYKGDSRYEEFQQYGQLNAKGEIYYYCGGLN